jgi:hypothetical protein
VATGGGQNRPGPSSPGGGASGSPGAAAPSANRDDSLSGGEGRAGFGEKPSNDRLGHEAPRDDGHGSHDTGNPGDNPGNRNAPGYGFQPSRITGGDGSDELGSASRNDRLGGYVSPGNHGFGSRTNNPEAPGNAGHGGGPKQQMRVEQVFHSSPSNIRRIFSSPNRSKSSGTTNRPVRVPN